jgi:prepilin-type processing-associated H-X9-DG protein
MTIASDLRKKPTSLKVQVTSGTGVDVAWADGHSSHFDFAYLREKCPCANCKDERAREADSGVVAAAPATAAANVLPMFKPKVKARHAEAVGHYAIQIEFSDGHRAGIYSYEYLRNICPCEICKKEFGES